MSQKYVIEYRRSVKKDLHKIDAHNLEAIVKKIHSLAGNPRPAGALKLQSTEDLYRVRVGDYRIIYEIADQKLVITIVKIGHRGGVYTK